MRGCVFSVYPFPLWWLRDIYIFYLIIIIKSEVWTITHCLGLSHETMVCSACLSIFLWICDMAGLLRATFVPWWYLPWIWPSVTDMQHYYHARYPTDDWHPAYMFLLVYFPSKCAWKACFPILLAPGEISASGSMHPSRCHHPPPPPLARKQNRTGVTWLLTCTKRGGIWTDAWVCLHYRVVIWVAG